MTGLRGTLGRMFGGASVEIEGAPPAELVVAPESAEQVARLLDFCSEHGLVVLPWGAGTHQGYGGRIDPDVVISTERFEGVEVWSPGDLTVVVGAGTTLGALAGHIGARGQSAILPEDEDASTIGGVVAAGISAWRRLRYGPTRDRVLEVVFVTGDGRVVKSGAQVVKNVTGYDVPKLMTGSFGSLGLITRVCLKLWPEAEASATVVVDDVDRALALAYRPLAVLETPESIAVYLSGTAAEVEGQAGALDGSSAPGLRWPQRPGGDFQISLRVPPAMTAEAVGRLDGARFVAAHGVGDIAAAIDQSSLEELRTWAESVGGAAVIVGAPETAYRETDPWGSSPQTAALQRRIKASFDPAGVLVPGRLPGGV